MNDYGKAIKTLRKQSQMTQTTLAEKLNISGQAVSKWENNLAQPDFDTIIKMTEIFGISLDEFTELSTDESVTATHTPVETKKEEKIIEQPKLLGVCSECGVSIYKEEELGARSPKLICKKCKIKKEKAEKLEAEKKEYELYEERRKEKNYFLKALIIPAIVIGLLMIVSTIASSSMTKANLGVILGGSIGGGLLAYLAVVQIALIDNFIADVFVFTFRKTFVMPGVIFTLDFDGIIWAICVKIGLSILAVLLSVAVSILGFILCCVLAPFFFPFSIASKVREIRGI